MISPATKAKLTDLAFRHKVSIQGYSWVQIIQRIRAITNELDADDEKILREAYIEAGLNYDKMASTAKAELKKSKK